MSRVTIVCPLCDGESPSEERDIGLCCKCNNGREPVFATLTGRDAHVYALGEAAARSHCPPGTVKTFEEVDRDYAAYEAALAALRAYDGRTAE